MTAHTSRQKRKALHHDWTYYLAGALFIIVMGYFVVQSLSGDIAGKATMFTASNANSIMYESFDNPSSVLMYDANQNSVAPVLVVGKSYKGISFSGSTFIYPKSTSSRLDYTSPITFAFWARPSPGGTVVSQRYTNDPTFGWKGFDIYVDNFGTVRIRAQSGPAADTQTVLEARTSAADWAHYIIVTDFRTDRTFMNTHLYINGKGVPLYDLELFGAGFTGIDSSTAPFSLGFIGDRVNGSTGFYKGDLDEFRVFRGMLGDRDASLLYGAPDDTDQDGFVDNLDNCGLIANAGQEDADNDRIGNVCDTCNDTDGDGYGNAGYSVNTCSTDNCPTVSNNQADMDHDGMGDACDTNGDNRQVQTITLSGSALLSNTPGMPGFGGVRVYCQDTQIVNGNFVCSTRIMPLRVCGTCPGGWHLTDWNWARNLLCELNFPNTNTVNLQSSMHPIEGSFSGGCFNCIGSDLPFDMLTVGFETSCQQD